MGGVKYVWDNFQYRPARNSYEISVESPLHEWCSNNMFSDPEICSINNSRRLLTSAGMEGPSSRASKRQ
jgi:hypothetical protein